MKQSILTIYTMALVRVIEKENFHLASLFNQVPYLYLSTQPILSTRYFALATMI